MPVTEKGIELARAVLKQAEATFAGYAAHHAEKAEKEEAIIKLMFPARVNPRAVELRQKQSRNHEMALLCREGWETALMEIPEKTFDVGRDRVPSKFDHADDALSLGESCDPYAKTTGASEK